VLASRRDRRGFGLLITALGLALVEGGVVLVCRYYWLYTEVPDAQLVAKVLEFQQDLVPVWRAMVRLNLLMILGLWLGQRPVNDGRKALGLRLGGGLLVAGASLAIFLAARHSEQQSSGFRLEQLEPPPNHALQRTEGSAHQRSDGVSGRG
jgi:hypothetical protein